MTKQKVTFNITLDVDMEYDVSKETVLTPYTSFTGFINSEGQLMLVAVVNGDMHLIKDFNIKNVFRKDEVK